MAASFSAETMKLIKRPATWILALVLVALVVIFGYLFTAMAAGVGLEDGETPPGVDAAVAASIMQTVMPESVLVTVLSLLSGIGGAVALILGALVAGSEYSWGTLKTVLTRRDQGRIGFFLGKFLAVVAVAGLLAMIALLAGAFCGYVVASMEDAPMDWPGAVEVLRGTAAAWLVLTAWAALGALLATAFRGTALAIGLGLVYALGVETVVAGLQARSDLLNDVSRVFIGKNSADLAGSFGDLPEAYASTDPVDPSQAAFVLVAYLGVSLLMAAFLIARRDVTS